MTLAGGIRRSAVKHIRVTFFFLAVALTLSGCGIFGGSDGTSDVTVAEDVEAQPTVNSVQPAPAETTDSTTDAGASDDADGTSDEAADGATAALPTAVTLPTAAPTPEPTVDRSQPTTYVVQSGDVLGLIAERFDADIAELRRVNGLDGNLIRVGQELTIPALDGSTDTGDATSGETASGSTAATPAPTSAPAATVSCNSNATGHCVQPGESLLGIALQYDVTVESLRAANPGISGDLIRSGEVINLPGSDTSDPAPAPTTAPSDPAPAGTPVPAATTGPLNDADCAARNPEFPFFHAADGLCYANPIGGATAVPTAVGGNTEDTCPEGRFLWEDGLCYPIPGVTVTPTPESTSTVGNGSTEDYGRPPCRDGYVVILSTNRCWPEASNTSPATVTPAPATTTTATTSAGNEVACVEPNFTEAASGTCFLLQEGLDAGCSVVDNKAICP